MPLSPRHGANFCQLPSGWMVLGCRAEGRPRARHTEAQLFLERGTDVPTPNAHGRTKEMIMNRLLNTTVAEAIRLVQQGSPQAATALLQDRLESHLGPTSPTPPAFSPSFERPAYCQTQNPFRRAAARTQRATARRMPQRIRRRTRRARPDGSARCWTGARAPSATSPGRSAASPTC